MFDVRDIFYKRYPGFIDSNPFLSRFLLSCLKLAWRQSYFERMSSGSDSPKGTKLIKKVLDDLNISVVIHNTQKIPDKGRLIIVANHPTGVVDGIGLLEKVYEIRSDVKLVLGSVLKETLAMDELLFEIDNIGGKITKGTYKEISEHLNNEGAIIIFPAGEVSRYREGLIQEGVWKKGFLKLSLYTSSPIIPLYIDKKNSQFFYLLGRLNKALSMLWVIPELFYHKNSRFDVYASDLIDSDQIDRALVDEADENKVIELIKGKVLTIPFE